MRPGIEIRMTTKESQLLEKILMDYGMKRTKKETWEWLRLFFFKEERIRKFEVPALTIVLVDTSALHRGGYCTSGERFLFTSTFTSFAGISPRLFSVPKSLFRVLDKSSNLSVTR